MAMLTLMLHIHTSLNGSFHCEPELFHWSFDRLSLMTADLTFNLDRLKLSMCSMVYSLHCCTLMVVDELC